MNNSLGCQPAMEWPWSSNTAQRNRYDARSRSPKPSRSRKGSARNASPARTSRVGFRVPRKRTSSLIRSARRPLSSAFRIPHSAFYLLPSYFLLLTYYFLLLTSNCHCHAQEGCRYRRNHTAFVLPVEKLFLLFLQISSSAILFRRFEGIHGWSVVLPELIHKLRGCAGKVERKRVPLEG